MTNAHGLDVRMDPMDDFTERERYSALTACLTGIIRGLFQAAAEIDDLYAAIGERPLDR